jgi:Fe-S-cluster containining protein
MKPGRGNDLTVMEEFYTARGWKMEVIGYEICISKPDRCPHLTEDNLCDIHETKPEVCKNWGETVPVRDPHCGCFVL